MSQYYIDHYSYINTFPDIIYYGRTNYLYFKLCHKFCERCYEYGNSNGHGKKYEMNGRLRFDGEYFNGIAWNGIQYDYDNNTTIILDIEN